MKILINTLSILLALAVIACPILTKGDTASLIALAQHDKKYVFNSEGPDTYDCSGLVMYAYGKLGREVEHWANGVANDDQYETFEKFSDARIGDLLFFDTVQNKVPADHVGIWIGSNRFVHASSSGEKVMISEMDDSWKERFIWGKRIEKIENLYPFLNKAPEKAA